MNNPSVFLGGGSIGGAGTDAGAGGGGSIGGSGTAGPTDISSSFWM